MRITAHIALATLGILATSARGSDITINDSVVSIGTNGSQQYVFSNPSNGLSVTVSVTMSPFSGVTSTPSFSLLDFAEGEPTRLGVESGTGGGDGNWVDVFEGADFSASLLSYSNGIVTNSIRFGIAGIGIRPDGGSLVWISSSDSRSFTPGEEGFFALDTGTAFIASTTYTGALRFAPNGDRFQFSNRDSLSGLSFVVRAVFVEGTGSPVVTSDPIGATNCAGSTATFVAEAVGDPPPTVLWQVLTNGGPDFVEIPGATTTTLSFAAILTDSGNQYRAVFSNVLGFATSSVATLSVVGDPSSLISPGAASVSPLSFTNTASAPAGEAGYGWSISNGVIASGQFTPSITFTAGRQGLVTLGVAVTNAEGCSSISSTQLVITALVDVEGGAGVYVSDYSGLVVKFDTNGSGSLFVLTNQTGASGLAFDRAGQLFVANYEVASILKYSTSGVDSVFASGLNSPYACAFDGWGNLFVANYDNGTVWKYATNGAGTLFTSALAVPGGLAFDRSGNLFVSDIDDGTVLKFTTNASSSLFAENLGNPIGLAFDSTGNLFVAASSENAIVKIAPDGFKTNFALGLNTPVGLAFDSDGYLYAVEFDRVRRFAPDGSGSIWATNYLTDAQFVVAWPMPSQLMPTMPAEFSSPILTNSQIRIPVTGSDGANYLAQATTNLVLADWVTLSTNTAPFEIIETNTADFPARYYRAIDAP